MSKKRKYPKFRKGQNVLYHIPPHARKIWRKYDNVKDTIISAKILGRDSMWTKATGIKGYKLKAKGRVVSGVRTSHLRKRN